MLGKLLNIFKVPELRTKLLWTLTFVAIYRMGIWIPVPGVDYEAVRRFADAQGAASGEENPLMAMFNLFSGGQLQNVALFALGIMPYISASIILQLLTKVWPALEAIAKEGQSGRDKINQYTRYLTILLCLIQGYIVLHTVVYQPINLAGQETINFVPPAIQTFGFTLMALLTFTAGTMFLLWLGELITVHGLGHGISMIIMLGIIDRLPWLFGTMANQVKDGSMAIGTPMALIVLYIASIAAVILITQGQRKIPIQYAKHTRGRKVYGLSQRTHFPIRLNMAGVMPVIFASSLLLFPTMVLRMLSGKWAFFQTWSALFNVGSWTYLTLTVGFVFFFSYFWNALMFNPTEHADRMKEQGAFIPGFTPGTKTAEFFEKIMNRMTLAGAAFLSLIAVLPYIVADLLNIDSFITSFIGGTGLLIVAGVALEIVTKVESHLIMRNYDGFMPGGGATRGRR